MLEQIAQISPLMHVSCVPHLCKFGSSLARGIISCDLPARPEGISDVVLRVCVSARSDMPARSQYELRLFDPADEDAPALHAAIAKRTTFYQTLARPSGLGCARRLAGVAHMLHLHRPDSRSLEVTLHVSPDSSEPTRALLALINPAASTLHEKVRLPLYYTGLLPGSPISTEWLNLSSAGALGSAQPPPQMATFVLGDGDPSRPFDISVNVNLAPRSYAALKRSVDRSTA